ncbi:hypothetical protein Ndes2526B_g02283 [Nannochloris sp. 'desiccata']|nr:hypothetical protein KSW81_003382 [Chlorella desiccata (nom. nud.)]KAH7622987.1 hypothetical protein NADE_007851 [Chlorella desiccata (nom. nud.)]
MSSSSPAPQAKESPVRGLTHTAFSSLSIWRAKIANDLQEVPTSNKFKLRLLLDQTKDLEQAVFGCLKDALFELHEASEWGLLSPAFVDTQRNHLLAQAAQELMNDKNLVLELAREHGEHLFHVYTRELQRAKIHSVSDYETLGQLRFAMLVWKVNLNQDLSITEDKQHTLQEGWREGVKLVRRCVGRSGKHWAGQQVADAPGRDEMDKMCSSIENKMRHMLDEMAESHHLHADSVALAVAAVPVDELENNLDEEEQESGGDVDRYMVPPVKEMYDSEIAG